MMPAPPPVLMIVPSTMTRPCVPPSLSLFAVCALRL